MASNFFQQNTSIFSYMSALAQKHQAINLSQGFPDFPVDSHLIELVAKAMREGHNQYAPMPGLADLREQISIHHQRSYGMRFNPETEITVTPGATQALQSVFASILQPGDEVVLFAPAYDSYAPMIERMGAKVVWVQLSEKDFSVPHQAFSDAINEKTKLVVINNPHNPSGMLWQKEDLDLLERLAAKWNFYVLADEVYEKICFLPDGYQSLSKLSSLRSKLFLVYSFGKTFHATGWKMGYVMAQDDLMQKLRSFFQYAVFSVNTPMQKGLADYLKITDTDNVAPMYLQKQKLFEEAMRNSAFKPLPTYGSYFQLFDYTELNAEMDDVEMAEWLTEKAGVASIPISVFYPNRPKGMRFLRFCFAKKDESLLMAAERLTNVCM